MSDKRVSRYDYKMADLINSRKVGIEKMDDHWMVIKDDYTGDYLFYTFEMDLLILQGR